MNCRPAAKIQGVVDSVARRSRIDGHIQGIAAIGGARNTGSGLLRPGPALIDAEEHPDRVGRTTVATRHGDIDHLHAIDVGR